MLQTGFEPVSSARKADILDRTRLLELYQWVEQDLNLRSSPCKGDVIATRPPTHVSNLRQKVFILLFNAERGI